MIEKALPHFFVSWVRNYILGMLLYMIVGGLWCLTIYGCCRNAAFGNEEIPTTFAIMEQIKVRDSRIFRNFRSWLALRVVLYHKLRSAAAYASFSKLIFEATQKLFAVVSPCHQEAVTLTSAFRPGLMATTYFLAGVN